MSVDYYAYALIGCEVTGKLYQTNANGERVPFDYLDEDNMQIGSLSVIRSRCDDDGNRWFCGIATTAAEGAYHGQEVKGPVVGFDKAEERVRKVLEPLGLWNPTSFKLWAINYCSY